MAVAPGCNLRHFRHGNAIIGNRHPRGVTQEWDKSRAHVVDAAWSAAILDQVNLMHGRNWSFDAIHYMGNHA
jgi:hypothetical protein